MFTTLNPNSHECGAALDRWLTTAPQTSGYYTDCPTCNGYGHIRKVKAGKQALVDCSDCDGSGQQEEV
jgi:DnaJ-class molecular chaperone